MLIDKIKYNIIFVVVLKTHLKDEKMRLHQTRTVFLSIFLVAVFTHKTMAQTASSSTNIEELKEILHKDQKATKIWWTSWLGLYSVGTLAQTGIALQTDNKALKQDMYIGAATTLLGAGFQLLTPMVKVEKSIYNTSLNAANEKEIHNKMIELLEKSAAFEEAGRSWQTHALTGVANLGGALITWLAFDRTFKDGLINFAINTAVTELQIWSQPIIAKKALSRYSEQMISELFIPEYKQQMVLSACATANGFQFKLIF